MVPSSASQYLLFPKWIGSKEAARSILKQVYVYHKWQESSSLFPHGSRLHWGQYNQALGAWASLKTCSRCRTQSACLWSWPPTHAGCTRRGSSVWREGPVLRCVTWSRRRGLWSPAGCFHSLHLLKWRTSQVSAGALTSEDSAASVAQCFLSVQTQKRSALQCQRWTKFDAFVPMILTLNLGSQTDD